MLIGGKVYLEAAQEDDAPTLAKWESDPKFLGDFFNVWPLRASDWKKIIEEEDDQIKGRTFIIKRHDLDEPAGLAGFFQPYTVSNFFRAYELWYQVHPDHRGHGVATAVARLLVNHLFSALPVERIEGNVVVENNASAKALKNAGMAFEGKRRSITFLNGRYADMDCFAITRSDWNSEQVYRRSREF